MGFNSVGHVRAGSRQAGAGRYYTNQRPSDEYQGADSAGIHAALFFAGSAAAVRPVGGGPKSVLYCEPFGGRWN